MICLSLSVGCSFMLMTSACCATQAPTLTDLENTLTANLDTL